MTEEQQQPTEKKKGCIYWSILKWAGLVLLSLLLLIALIFQAPWKVTLLLAIFLLACTILPKPYKKHFWGGTGIVVIILIIWVFLPTETEGWKPFTFDEEIDAYKAQFAIPDEENAALIYNKIFDNYDSNVIEPNLVDEKTYDLIGEKFWSSKDYPAAAELLKEQENTIRTLIEASKIDKCSFPLTTNIFEFGHPLEDLIKIRHLTRVLIWSANNDVAEKRIEAALEKYNCVTKIGKHMCQQPTTLDCLVGMAIENLAIRQLKKFVVLFDSAETHLCSVDEMIGSIKHDWSHDLPKFLNNEKIMTKTFLSLFYEINKEGKIRLSRYSMAKLKPQSPEEFQAKPFLQRKAIKTSTILVWLFMPSTPQKAAKIIDEAFEKNYAMADPEFDWEKEHKTPLSFVFDKWGFVRIKFNYHFLADSMADMISVTHYKTHDCYLKMLATKRGCLLLVALRRFKDAEGTWPQNLEQIKGYTNAENFIDPINDGSFVYKLTDDNFTLYSRGKNNIDESGEDETKWDPNTTETKVLKDDWLIWPLPK